MTVPTTFAAATAATGAQLDGNFAACAQLNANNAFSGTNTVPTAAVGTNTTQIASTAFVLANSTVATVIPTITATVAANALTVGTSAQQLSFRSATAGSGAITTITATPAALVVPSGATLGTIAATAARLAILELLNAGVAELAIVNLAGGNQLDETNLITTTAITTGATAANVIYSTIARTSVPYRVVGFIDITEAAAGTWATAPSLVQGCGGQALAAMSSIGYGQTYQSVVRNAATNYYNTTGRPILLSLVQPAASTFQMTLNGLAMYSFATTSSYGMNHYFVIPPGAVYSFSCTLAPIGIFELR